MVIIVSNLLTEKRFQQIQYLNYIALFYTRYFVLLLKLL